MLPKERTKELLRASYNFYVKAKNNNTRSEWESTNREACNIAYRFNNNPIAVGFLKGIYTELYNITDNEPRKEPLSSERDKAIFNMLFELLQQVQLVSSSAEWETVKKRVAELVKEYPESLARDIIRVIVREAYNKYK